MKYLDKTENNSLYIQIWEILDRYHKFGFWKKIKLLGNSSNDSNKKEFIGLKNLTSTCYMNSILQQFFMRGGKNETVFSYRCRCDGQKHSNDVGQERPNRVVLARLHLQFWIFAGNLQVAPWRFIADDWTSGNLSGRPGGLHG